MRKNKRSLKLLHKHTPLPERRSLKHQLLDTRRSSIIHTGDHLEIFNPIRLMLFTEHHRRTGIHETKAGRTDRQLTAVHELVRLRLVVNGPITLKPARGKNSMKLMPLLLTSAHTSPPLDSLMFLQANTHDTAACRAP